MATVQNYMTAKQVESFTTLTPEEAAAYWSEDAVAERERDAPKSWE